MRSNFTTRPRRSPTQRNLDIYTQVKIHGRRQIDVAADKGITQSRISRILAQVEAWRAVCAQHDPLTRADHRRLERSLARERWELIYQRSLAELDASNRTLAIERSGKRGDKDFTDTTKREQSANVQWLKTAARAAESLLKLAELDPVPPPESWQERDRQASEDAWVWLVKQRTNAESTRRVPHSGDIHEIVDQWLALLLGPQNDDDVAKRQPPHPALQELARRILAQTPADEPAASPPLPLGEGRGEGVSTHHSPTDHGPQTADTNCHIRHTPSTPAPPPCPPASSAPHAATTATANSFSSADTANAAPAMTHYSQENSPHMTPQQDPPPNLREPWEDEYDQLRRQRPIRLLDAVVYP